MVIGKFNSQKDASSRKKIELGPLEVSGTINGAAASTSNLAGTYLFDSSKHIINATIK